MRGRNGKESERECLVFIGLEALGLSNFKKYIMIFIYPNITLYIILLHHHIHGNNPTAMYTSLLSPQGMHMLTFEYYHPTNIQQTISIQSIHNQTNIHSFLINIHLTGFSIYSHLIH